MLARDRRRFWSFVSIKIPITSVCWQWHGDSCRSDGYGRFFLDGTTVRAHRAAFEDIIGPVPAGLVLDHLCRNRGCVNPFHLEPVTSQENTLRGLSPALSSARLKARHRARTHCKHGHRFTAENTYRDAKGRCCRACRARCRREYDERQKQRKNGNAPPSSTAPGSAAV